MLTVKDEQDLRHEPLLWHCVGTNLTVKDEHDTLRKPGLLWHGIGLDGQDIISVIHMTSRTPGHAYTYSRIALGICAFKTHHQT